MPTHNRILIIRPDRIGDVVLATPTVRALRKRFPEAYIAMMVRPYTAEILAGNPHLDEILVDDPDGEGAGSSGFRRQVSALRQKRFDTALMLLASKRHAWMTFFAGIGTRIGVGEKVYHRLTFARTVSRRKFIPLRHEADYCLDLARAIGVEGDGLGTEVFLFDGERADMAGRLGGTNATLVGIHPGSGKSAPNWRVHHYVELAERVLSRNGTRVILTGSPGERDLADAFRHLDGNRAVNLVGELSLRETMSAISHVSALVSASTGTMHIAAALGVPTVSLFCPLPACSPDLWGPQGNHSDVILPPEAYCATKCPGDPHICDLEGGVDVDTVFDRVSRALERPAG